MNIAYIYILLKCVPFSNPREYSKIGDLTLTTLFWSPSPYSHLVTCKKGCHSVQRWWACSGLCTTFILGATIVSFWRESIRVKLFHSRAGEASPSLYNRGRYIHAHPWPIQMLLLQQNWNQSTKIVHIILSFPQLRTTQEKKDPKRKLPRKTRKFQGHRIFFYCLCNSNFKNSKAAKIQEVIRGWWGLSIQGHILLIHVYKIENGCDCFGPSFAIFRTYKVYSIAQHLTSLDPSSSPS